MDTNQQYITNGGKVKIKQTKRGIEFHGWNFQHQRMVHIGTLKGRRYEKVAPILRKPDGKSEPSFCLTQSELGAALDHGAQLLGIILPDDSATYAIDLPVFNRLKIPYNNRFYGRQWRVPEAMFQRSNKVVKRNASMDNPPLPVEVDVIEQKQMVMFP